MGESARRKKIEERLAGHAASGLLTAVEGSPLYGKPPEHIARHLSASLEGLAVLAALDAGQPHAVACNVASDPVPETANSVPPVFDFSGGERGLGPELLAAVRRSIADPAIRENIYAMPYEDAETLLADHKWFGRYNTRWLRVRPLMAVERQIGEVRDGWVDRVVVIASNHGVSMRHRFAFGCPEGDPDARIDMNDREIAELVLRYAKHRVA